MEEKYKYWNCPDGSTYVLLSSMIIEARVQAFKREMEKLYRLDKKPLEQQQEVLNTIKTNINIISGEPEEKQKL